MSTFAGRVRPDVKSQAKPATAGSPPKGLTNILISLNGIAFHFYTAHFLYCKFGSAQFFRTAQTISDVFQCHVATPIVVNDVSTPHDSYLMNFKFLRELAS